MHNYAFLCQREVSCISSLFKKRKRDLTKMQRRHISLSNLLLPTTDIITCLAHMYSDSAEMPIDAFLCYTRYQFNQYKYTARAQVSMAWITSSGTYVINTRHMSRQRCLMTHFSVKHAMTILAVKKIKRFNTGDKGLVNFQLYLCQNQSGMNRQRRPMTHFSVIHAITI